MPPYYLDSSALVKRYVAEIGTAWTMNLTDPSSANEIWTVQIAAPEVIAAIFRKVRIGALSRHDASHISANFRADWQMQYLRVDVTDNVIRDAMTLVERHGLRGYDAVHLAAALSADARLRAESGTSVTFISADLQQLQAARAEGLLIDDPNAHP